MIFFENQIVYREKGLVRVPRVVEVNKDGTYNTKCLNTGLYCMLGASYSTMVKYYGKTV